jgi:anti-anti-sigma factor
MALFSPLQYEIEKADSDQAGNKVTAIRFHGRLISENADELKDLLRPLIAQGGRIVVDLGDVNYLDSSGLGALLGLKVSAIKSGLCILQFENMTPRVLELLRISNLTQIFSS